VANKLINTSPEKELELDRLTVEEWLTKLGQSDISRKYLWDVITIGALNNHPKNVSALMLFRILRAAFLGDSKNASLLIPKVGLSELFVNPAVQFIKTHGGEVRTGISVESIILEGTNVRSVRTSEGKSFKQSHSSVRFLGIRLRKFNRQVILNQNSNVIEELSFQIAP